jgi:type IV pilus assembly protein PilC
MLLSRSVPLPCLIEFTCVVRYNLSAGLTLRRVLRQQAERGPMAIRPVAERISKQLEQGESFEEALKGEKAAFPPLFISLAAMGEQTGALPEVLAELEKFYVFQQRLQREFLRHIAWRMLHYVGAFGLLIGAYYFITRILKQRELVDTVLLRTWVIGPTLQAMAMTRFCFALCLTTESGMPIAKALCLSMRATGNGAFRARVDNLRKSIRNGEGLPLALRKTDVFPEDFLDIVESAEEAGRLSEALRHQTNFYEEETRRRLTTLTTIASWAFFLGGACLIFRILPSFISRLSAHIARLIFEARPVVID